MKNEMCIEKLKENGIFKEGTVFYVLNKRYFTVDKYNLKQNKYSIKERKELFKHEDLENCLRKEILNVIEYKNRLIWKFRTHWQVEGYGECKTLKESKEIIKNQIFEEILETNKGEVVLC